MLASGSSFVLSLVYTLRRLHQYVTVIISQSTDQQKMMNRSSILLCHCCSTPFPLQCSFSDCLIVDNMPFVSDNILNIFQVRKWFTPSFIDKFLQDIPIWVIKQIQIWRMRCPFLWADEIGRVVSKKMFELHYLHNSIFNSSYIIDDVAEICK